MPSILNSDDGVVSGTSGLKSTGGNDGLLNIQSNGSTIVAVTGSGISVTGTVSQTGVSTFAAGTVSAPSITFTGDTNTGIFSPAADTIAFTEGGVESMRIDSSGRMLVGSTTARVNLFNSTITSPLQVEGTGNDTSSTLVVRNSNDTGGPFYILAKTRGTTVGSNTVVQADDFLGSIRFQGSDGTEFVDAAMIQVQVGGTPGANDMPGTMIFYTTADGSASPTERMRINSSGGVQFNAGISVGGTAPASEGSGVKFPATQVASTDANTLDDYEEGTFTPTVGGTWTSNPTNLAGRYTKIGDLVCIWVTWTGGTKASAISGHIAGMPFTVSSAATGTVSDVDVINRGIGLLDTGSRIFLTNTSFSASTNYTSYVYRT